VFFFVVSRGAVFGGGEGDADYMMRRHLCLCFADCGLYSGCDIGKEGCVALAGALQGHSAVQCINLWSA
jgi:hypothetical protein